eukprot:scaffold24360_cov135-Isochrysis_galbana.AAC.2
MRSSRPPGNWQHWQLQMPRSALVAAILCACVAQETTQHGPHPQQEPIPRGAVFGRETLDIEEPPNAVPASQAEAAPRSQPDHAKLKMEDLGPVVLGRDGAMSLIGNWAELNQAERAAAWKAVATRNAKRKVDILAREAEEQLRRTAPMGRLRTLLQQLSKRAAMAWKWLRGKHSRSRRLAA